MDQPLSRQPSCHVCPHEHHILPCDTPRCDCAHDVAPGIYDTTTTTTT